MKSVWSASQSRRLLGALVAVGLAVLFTAGLTAGLNTSSANKQGRYDPTRGNNEEQGVTNTTQVKESNDDMWTFNTVGIPNTGSNGLSLFHPSVTTGFEEQGNDGTLKREVNTSHYNQSTVANSTTVTPNNQSTVANTRTVTPYNQSIVANTRTVTPYNQSIVANTRTVTPYNQSIVASTRTGIRYNQSTVSQATTVIGYSQTTVANTRTVAPYNQSIVANTRTVAPYNQSIVANTRTVAPYNQSTVSQATAVIRYSQTTFGNTRTVAPYNQSTVCNTATVSLYNLLTVPESAMLSRTKSTVDNTTTSAHTRSTVIGPAAGDSQTGHQPGVTTRANVQHSNPGTVGTETRADLVTPAEPTTSSPHFCTTNASDSIYIADTIRYVTNTDFVKCFQKRKWSH